MKSRSLPDVSMRRHPTTEHFHRRRETLICEILELRHVNLYMPLDSRLHRFAVPLHTLTRVILVGIPVGDVLVHLPDRSRSPKIISQCRREVEISRVKGGRVRLGRRRGKGVYVCLLCKKIVGDISTFWKSTQRLDFFLDKDTLIFSSIAETRCSKVPRPPSVVCSTP